VQVNEPDSSASAVWLSRYAKLVVIATFALILIGGHTTTSGAGMAFPDWPLSHGSINPNGWWENFMQRLEHGHRLVAETVALMIGILCTWVWGSKWSLPLALSSSVLLAVAAKLLGAPRMIVAHIGLWSAALVFALLILFSRARREARGPTAARWLAFAAFLGVCAQAALGGLRVTLESGGDPTNATTFRIMHGCFAQAELCLLVALATILSPLSSTVLSRNLSPSLRRSAWITAALIYLQLIAGATMRHLGAGLAISTFPRVHPDGGWLPKAHNFFIDLNFTHTRIGALLVTIAVAWLVVQAFTHGADEPLIRRAALLLVALTAAQLVFWHACRLAIAAPYFDHIARRQWCGGSRHDGASCSARGSASRRNPPEHGRRFPREVYRRRAHESLCPTSWSFRSSPPAICRDRPDE
jgi:cytochrome c oxidase assembly protein subunit 15